MVALALARRRRPRRGVGARRARGHARRLGRRRPRAARHARPRRHARSAGRARSTSAARWSARWCFGRLTDKLGRKRLFLRHAGRLSAGDARHGLVRRASGLLRRCATSLTGAGIGGEYAAINSAIDELIPARVRGRVNLAINGSFWVGAALGAGLSLVLLDPRVLGPVWGWRAGFGLGAVLAVAILLVRRDVPESPRWLISHGRAARGRGDHGRRASKSVSRAAPGPSPDRCTTHG